MSQGKNITAGIAGVASCLVSYGCYSCVIATGPGGLLLIGGYAGFSAGIFGAGNAVYQLADTEKKDFDT
jgi:hypothetical protein